MNYIIFFWCKRKKWNSYFYAKKKKHNKITEQNDKNDTRNVLSRSLSKKIFGTEHISCNKKQKRLYFMSNHSRTEIRFLYREKAAQINLNTS